MLVCGDSSALVVDGDGAVFFQSDGDFFPEAGEGFVDGVIDEFGDEVVEGVIIGSTDVHAGSFAYGF